ncbi:MAG: methionyl-tRNA formyltransferase [Clostridiaceae bacterium]|nr:methionyl-tRNA formyltransferase [Clostridiaceae bacterium]
MKKTVFIGSVLSSKVALETLIKNDIKVDLVCSLDEEVSKNVSDYFPIHEIAIEKKLPYFKFKKIDSSEVKEEIKAINPDFIFVIGLSQLIPQEILDMASDYSIGFHPTPLPKHRGRAALPWQIILGVEESEVSLFKLDEGMDSGDIIAQYPYKIEKTDYAFDVYNKVCGAMAGALNDCLPKMYSDKVEFVKQNHDDATYLLIRRPEDGHIDWGKSSNHIETLIRATSRPYPGAFSIYKDNHVTIWKARVEKNTKYTGLPGQIAFIDNDEIGVITNDGILIIEEYEMENPGDRFIIGHKFK